MRTPPLLLLLLLLLLSCDDYTLSLLKDPKHVGKEEAATAAAATAIRFALLAIRGVRGDLA
jgi:hypothetical protein